MSSAAATKVRGSEAVKAALIDAAADMLGEVGPRSISVRDVADRAGVNHGQIHHYFGSKRGLLEDAMRHLAREHFDHAMARQGDAAYPPPLSLAEDVRYWRAIAQAVIEGDLELAGIEIEEGISVPQHVLAGVQATRGDETDELDLKAAFAVMAAQQLGWVAFERFVFMLGDVPREQETELRERAKALIQRTLDRGLE